MKFGENWKRFWTLDRHHAAGFTLVELIVVIAILAILAGVAVPAYNGYITQANIAADEALLSAINTAFAAACLQNGVDMANLNGASMPLNADKTVKLEGVEPYGEQFEVFYSGNEASAFKVFTSIVYSPTAGKFVTIEDAEDVAITVNGKIYTASGADIAKVMDSTWAKELTGEELLNMVADNAALVQTIWSGGYYDMVIGSGSFKDDASELLGMSYTDYMSAQIEEEAKKLCVENGWDWSNPVYQARAKNAVSGEIQSKVDSNLLVLVSAKNAGTAGSGILELLKKDGGKEAKQDLINSVKDTSSTVGLSQTMLAYGLYNSYVHAQNWSEEEKQDALNPVDAVNSFDDPDFQEYLDSPQGQKDLDGLLASMNVINSQGPDTMQSTVINGINNADLMDALNQVMGK